VSSSLPYKAANGAFISSTDSVRQTLDFDSVDKKVWAPRKIHPSFDSKHLRNINSILAERRKSKSKKPLPTSKPLLQIKKLPSVPITQRFTKSLYSITRDVYKPTLPFPNPQTEQPVRKKGTSKNAQERKRSIFIDDCAIESDGEGGDIPSVHSSPDRSTILKFVICDLCSLEVSSAKQLEKHRGSKKCRKLRKQGKTTIKCNTCNKVFISTHDLLRHQFSKKH